MTAAGITEVALHYQQAIPRLTRGEAVGCPFSPVENSGVRTLLAGPSCTIHFFLQEGQVFIEEALT